MCWHMSVEAIGQPWVSFLRRRPLISSSLVSHEIWTHYLGEAGWPVCSRAPSPPPQLWGSKWAQPCPAFLVGVVDQRQVLLLVREALPS